MSDHLHSHSPRRLIVRGDDARRLDELVSFLETPGWYRRPAALEIDVARNGDEVAGHTRIEGAPRLIDRDHHFIEDSCSDALGAEVAHWLAGCGFLERIATLSRFEQARWRVHDEGLIARRIDRAEPLSSLRSRSDTPPSHATLLITRPIRSR